MEAVNIKALAKELHCSTQPVYLSFASMDELREELIPIIEHMEKENIYVQVQDQCHLDKVFYDENSISYAVMH